MICCLTAQSHGLNQYWPILASDNGLLPYGTKPWPKPILINIGFHTRAIPRKKRQVCQQELSFALKFDANAREEWALRYTYATHSKILVLERQWSIPEEYGQNYLTLRTDIQAKQIKTSKLCAYSMAHMGIYAGYLLKISRFVATRMANDQNLV